MPASDVFVSVVAPLQDDAGILEVFVTEVMAVLESAYTNFELVLVDDGSHDNTPVLVDALLKAHRCMRYVRLSRRFGLEVAIAAGLDTVIGDYTVVMLPASDPPKMLVDLVALARKGQGVAHGYRQDRRGDPLWRRAVASVFWSFARVTFKLEAPRGVTYFQALSRQAVNALTRIRDKHRSLRLLTSVAGFEAVGIPYRPLCRGGKSHVRGFWASVTLAISMVVSQSTRPLRVVSTIGLGASFLNLLYMVYVVAIYLMKSHVQEGWTTSSLQSSAMFFLLFLILSVLSEYVGRVLEETRDRPLYHAAEERQSNVMVVAAERRNVVKESA